MTLKNPELVNIRDSIDSSSVEGLRIYFRRCINETQSVVCASDEDIDQHIGKYYIMLSTLINFVEYEDVEPGVGPIKRVSTTALYESLKQDMTILVTRMFSFIEH